MNKLLLKFLLLTYASSNIHAEIKSENFGYSLVSIESFFPGKSVEEIKKDKTIQSDIFEDNGDSKILRFKVRRRGYKLDILTQVKGDKITDMFVRLPQHFSHDAVLADLQKRFKKQDGYAKTESSALYKWMNREGNNVIYQGSCSITCFPMFVEVTGTDKTIVPMFQKFNEAVPKW